MSSNRFLIHAAFAAISFTAAGASIVTALRLGALTFLKENFIGGLCVDVWDGFFLSPLNLIAIAFLMFLPFHCYQVGAPHSILCLTTLMGFPSLLFFTAAFLETSPVILPLGLAVGCFGKFGWSELELATKSSKRHQIRSKSPTSKVKSSNRQINLSSSSEELTDDQYSKTSSLIKRKRRDS
ncbi:hypothetical protein CROQUDRAFT_100700 [Cronartium quercuum f. sp. fusiforme G11]|uniref:Uncharacterized protein n=1 Tax=Cronartium quercuum f. sp. fusiforme G11 TaxID=708437 RepID=A0A9P6N9Q5_9BASI|nr:hypothetical protein CROQUDRAFT_100700 [Cronartium quercuum f. sp. fusiforme G11]